jgi:hypothetical protein
MAFYNEINNKYNIITSFTNNAKFNFGAFANGYHEAANILAKTFLSKPGFRDYEGYPIIFLYRHAFELNLKNIIYWSERLCSFKNIEILTKKLYNNHNLSQLADISTKLLLKLFSYDKAIPNLSNEIVTKAKEFEEIDPTSYSYRYPMDTKGNYSTKKHQIVNIFSVAKNMDELLTNLEAVNFGLDYETNQIEDIFDLLNEFSNL